MKKKANYSDRRQHDTLKMQSKAAGDQSSKDISKNERIELLKHLYAEWLKKRNSILNINRETYLFNEPYELDTESYWYGS